MANTYRLTTLKDVFEQVPKDKLETCLSEIARGMLYAHELSEIAGQRLQWQEPCEWIDDDKTDQTIDVQDSDTGQTALKFVARHDA